MIRRVLAAALLLCAASAAAEPLSVVKDINRTLRLPEAPEHAPLGTGELLTLCAASSCGPFFLDDDGLRYLSPLDHDPHPGSTAGYAVVGDVGYFISSYYGGLWRTDGTAEGTRKIIEDHYSGPIGRVGSQVMFTGYAWQLKVSDGTAYGTRDLPLALFNRSNPSFVAPLGNKTIFTAKDFVTELWVTDGIGAAVSLKKFSPDSFVTLLGVSSGKAYLRERYSTGRTVWVTDGTVGGTFLVTNENPSGFAILNGVFYFVSQAGVTPMLVRANVTRDGTTPIVGYTGMDAQLMATRDSVYFFRQFPEGFFELHRSNGTAAGTTLVRQFTEGAPSSVLGAPDAVYFTMIGPWPSSASTNWRSDGTAAGTASFYSGAPVLDARAFVAGRLLMATTGDVAYSWKPGQPQPEPLLAPPDSLSADSLCGTAHAAVNSKVVFLANDGLHGCEAWVTDGTAAGTRMLVDGVAGATGSAPSGRGSFVVAGDTVFYGLQQSGGSAMWSTDGDTATRLAIPLGTASPRSSVNGRLLYFDGVNVRSYDPATLQSATLVAGNVGGGAFDATSHEARFDGILYFLNSGRSLVRTDGTPAGTSTVLTFPFGQDAQALYRVGDRIVLVVGGSLWVSDGTAAGTAALAGPIPAGTIRTAVDIVGGALVVSATDGLWRTDGTVAGTWWFSAHKADGFTPRAVVGPLLYFSENQHLVVTDGSGAGTRALGGPSIMSTSTFTADASFGVVDGALYFMGLDSSDGGYLWMTTGTTESTVMVETVGPVGSYESNLRVQDNDIYRTLLAPVPNGLLVLSGRDSMGGHEPSLVRSDHLPNAFSFPAVVNAPTSGWAVSAGARILGINLPTPVFVTGGEACVSSDVRCNCEIAAFAATNTAVAGDWICARVMTPATPNTIATADVQVGGFATAFSATTWSASADSLSFAATPVTVLETGVFSVPVYRTGSGTGAASVRWTTAAGTATPGSDYGTGGDPSEVTGVLSWPDGDTSARAITLGPGQLIPIANDGVQEPLETFRIVLSEPVGATLAPYAETTVTIDSTNSSIEFESPSATVSEGGIGVTIGVRRTGSLADPVAVQYVVTPGTAQRADYGPESGTVTFAAGVARATFYIGLARDDGVEGPETFHVALVDPEGGATLGALTTMDVTIDDLEPTVAFSKDFFLVSESVGNATIGLVRTGPLDRPATVYYKTLDGSVSAPASYLSRTGSVTWAAGEGGTKSITVPIVDNSVAAGPYDNFYFWMALIDSAGARIAKDQAPVHIVDDDNTLQFSSATAKVAENAGSVTLTINRSDVCCREMSVNWAVTGGTATRGADFVAAASGTVTWESTWSGPKTITIPIVDDDLAEGDETFTITLSSPVGAKLGAIKAITVTIQDNDAGIAFSQPAYSVGENGANLTVTVNRTGSATSAASVNWATANGTAIAGEDFGIAHSGAQRSGTLTWAAGQSTPKTITVPILQDTVYEGPEQFTIVLSNAIGSPLAKPKIATVTIVDDEIPPESSIGFVDPKPLVMENAGSAVLTVRRAPIGGGFTVPATVTYSTQAGTALAASDFVTRTGTLTWAAADGADKTLSLPIVNNTTAEPVESFKVTLSTTSPGAILGAREATVMILDDDEKFPPSAAIPPGWNVPGAATRGWHVSGDVGAYEGVVSLRSDAIGDSETAQVEVTRIFVAGNVTFRAKVSSEAGFDKLRFFVDGVEKGSWSGTAVAGWTLFTTPIAPGPHTLRWSYEKDGSASIGQDAAWIDAVSLP